MTDLLDVLAILNFRAPNDEDDWQDIFEELEIKDRPKIREWLASVL